MTDYRQRLLSAAAMTIREQLKAAASTAYRFADAFEDRDGEIQIALTALGIAILKFEQRAPELLAVNRLAHASAMKGGKPS